MMEVTMSVEFNHLGAVGRGFRQKSKKAVRDFGRAILDDAKSHARVKTGAYRASIYMKTQQSNGYSEASSEALRLNKKATVFDDIDPVTNELEVVFAIAVKYGQIVHDGSGRRSPNPVLSDALFRHYEEWNAMIAQTLDRVLKEESRFGWRNEPA